MAARGLRQADAAARLGIARRTFLNLVERDERAAAAWERGHSELYEEILGTLIGVARDADNPRQVLAALAIMSNVFGWKDGGDREVRANVRIELPAPLPREEYERRALAVRTIPAEAAPT